MVDYLHHEGHEKYTFSSLADLKSKLKELGLDLPVSEDLSLLSKPVNINSFQAPNALVVHPMEGCDGTADGAPTDLTFRRYQRFAAGGSGMLWCEATAVVPEGRANPRQLAINPDTLAGFKKLQREIVASARETMGEKHRPLMILQLTHSGRYAKPVGKPEPIIARHAKPLDEKQNLTEDYPLITDEELDNLQAQYVKAAGLAAAAGFDGVDIKACHGYLINGLLAAHNRENSKYGGNYENRTRFLLNVVKKIREEFPDFLVCTRLNVYDAIPYPYGFGMKTDGSMECDLSDPIKLINQLSDLGVELINVAMGNPYYNPHVERPYDKPVAGGYIPDGHPLENIAYNMEITREITKGIPEKVVTIASGLSWLRNFIPQVGAGLIENGWCDLIGLGRMFFAYPDFTRDLLKKGELVSSKMCIGCSSCSEIMRVGAKTGCPIRDREVYASVYQEVIEGK